MIIAPDYLRYPRRRYGYDHDLYEWSMVETRAPIRWSRGSVAIWFCVSLEWFPIRPNDTPFRAPGHMQTAYPDFRHYTARDYGTRIGLYRLLDALAAAGVTASFAINAAIADRYPQAIADVAASGHEIIAHSTDMNGTIASGLGIEAERALIALSLDTLERATGQRPRGWLSIAQSQSWATPDLLRDTGIDFTCDWGNDDLPWRFANGLANLPLNPELSDRQVVSVHQQSSEDYAAQLRDAYDWLAAEAAQQGNGRILPIWLTPWISGLPYRIGAIEGLLADLSAQADAWIAPAHAIFDEWNDQQSPVTQQL